MATNQNEEGPEEKIVYDWSPPTGQKQNFYFRDHVIDRKFVRTTPYL